MSKMKFSPTKAQTLAIGFEGADLIISAGAGSGKTATLTKRITKRVTENGDDIARKLVVTFTKDAAGELRSRISTAFTDILKNDASNKHICEQLVRLSSADICTIDAFCLKLVRANFELLGLDSSFKIADEGESEVLCREAISAVLDRFYDEKGDDVDFLRVCDCFSSFSGEEKLKDELLSLYKRLITTKNGIETLTLSPDYDGDFMKTPYGKVVREELLLFLNHYIAFFESALDDIRGFEDAERAFLVPFSSDLDFAKRLRGVCENGTYTEICECISSYSPERLGPTTKVASVDGELFKTIRADFKDKLRADFAKSLFASTPEALSSSFEKNKSVLLALYDILSELDREYASLKRGAGLCDFNDITRYALALLCPNGEPSELAREIADSYDEIYVDEYQDTNYLQDRIFYSISKGNRFLVGDIKQSIYRFRSAEPEIFSSYLRAFESIDNAPKGTPCKLHMSDNFRCDKGVIDFSNALSSLMFGKTRAIPYSSEDALIFAKGNADYESDKAEIYIIDKTRDDEDDDESLLKREAQFVAQKIKEYLDLGYLANGRKIEPRDIAILLRGFKKPVKMYVEALEARGIPTEYRGDEHFFEKSEILLTLCVLNAIDNPLRDSYLAGAMRSGVFGFSLEELVKIRAFTKDAPSLLDAVRGYNGEDGLKIKVDEFLTRLSELRREAKKKNSCEMIALVYSLTPIMSMADDDARENLLRLYEIARSYEGGAYKGLYAFLRYVEGIKESSGKEELGSGDENSVKLMSIHASKGLEFEVCFVCACGSQLNSADIRDPILYHRDLGVSAYVSRDRGIAKFNTLLRRASALAIRRAGVEEEMRMLYVAMTRARSRLIFTAGVPEPERFIAKCDKMRRYVSEYSLYHPKNYIEWALIAGLENPDTVKISTVSAEEIEAISNGDTATERELSRDKIEQIKEKLRARFAFEYPHSHLNKLPSKMSVSRLYPKVLDEEENAGISPKYSLDDEPEFIRGKVDAPTGADRGTATHIFMQFCSFEGLLQNGASAELERLVREGFISRSTSELVNTYHLEKFRKSALLDELLRAKDIKREFRFNVMLDASEFTDDTSLKGEKILVQGVIDCLYENDKGEVVLVDYKTDFVTEDDCEKTLKERHSLQLSYYKRAIELMLERPLSKTLIYSVPLAKTVEI